MEEEEAKDSDDGNSVKGLGRPCCHLFSLHGVQVLVLTGIGDGHHRVNHVGPSKQHENVGTLDDKARDFKNEVGFPGVLAGVEGHIDRHVVRAVPLQRPQHQHRQLQLHIAGGADIFDR